MRKEPFALAGMLICTIFLFMACAATIPKEALQLSPESLKDKQIQTRYFETRDEAKILAASAAVLQDLGFTIDESETDLGLVLGTKDRDAQEVGQQVAAAFMAVLLGANVPTDKNQKIRASIVTRPLEKKDATAVRITMQRIVWNTNNQVSKCETICDELIYQEFFDKLSQSVFLEAHEI